MTQHKVKTHVRPRGGQRRPAEKVIADLLIHIFRDRPHALLIAIGGPGGTDKSAFAGKLKALLPESSVFPLDDYKTPRKTRQDRRIFGAHPDANNMDLLMGHLDCIRQGKTFEKPVYDAVAGTADSTVPFHPRRFNLLDGEISTYPQFRDMVDFSIFIDSDWTTQLNTRIRRDIIERKYSREKAIATFLESNLREFQNFGAASKTWADVHIYCREDYHLIVESVSEEIYHDYESLLIQDLAAVDLSGLIVPLCTPFDKSDRIDQAAYIRHLEYLADHGIRRILAAGTTGEFFSLLPGERRQLLSLARRYFPGVVLFQAGAESLALTLEQISWAEDFGADAVLVLPPYYYAGVTEEGLASYFAAVYQKTHLPLMLYHFPRHTKLTFSSEFLTRIPHFGMKDSSATLDLIPATPHYYVGGDPLILEAAQRGATGFFSARANACPELYVRMESLIHHKDWKGAKTVQKEIGRIHEATCNPGEIQKIKTAVAGAVPGYPAAVRLPLISV
ncbi:dihydrodipicolinate synthase family protein [bacterium]|nr:dihydrodipicolinate synthase family protein [bacterium]